ncbi:serine acetyltransferase [Cycloclasticus pugetii]|jgi:serine O-acetyltransferase|uniref:serine acetyltransferase n=1 Tax=Cycloclasticus pugetii TaxID=34068 RepID=UPI00091FE3A1|nr:serine acetyltransferase [Cycloclasticus pugetii]SHJ63509.1 serine O-acetyltransferase [Cycloclasticus pugetii]
MSQQQADIKKEIKQDWQSDLARYPSRPWLKEVSIIAIAWYRHGLHVDNMSEGIWKKISLKIYWFIFHIIEILTGISLPKTVKVGGGLRIHHFGNIFIHKNAVIGKNCTLRQGVTLGNRYNDEVAPVLCDNVELGAYAQVLGEVTLGDSCKIGAMSVVLMDVPDKKTACGNPARILK